MDKEKDFVSKRVDDIEQLSETVDSLTKTVDRKPYAFFILALSIVCGYLFIKVQTLNNQIVEEVRKQNRNETIPAMERRVDEKLEEKVSPIKEGVEKATDKVDTILKNLQE